MLEVSSVSTSYTVLLIVCLFDKAILVDMKWYLTVGLMYIFLAQVMLSTLSYAICHLCIFGDICIQIYDPLSLQRLFVLYILRNHILWIHVLYRLNLNLFLYSSPKDMFIDFREREALIRERTFIGSLRYVPWLEIKPTTFYCTGWCSNQLSHRAMVGSCLYKI